MKPGQTGKASGASAKLTTNDMPLTGNACSLYYIGLLLCQCSLPNMFVRLPLFSPFCVADFHDQRLACNRSTSVA